MTKAVHPKRLLPVAIIPVLLVLFFVVSAFTLGNPGFKLDKTQHGLRVSDVYETTNPVQSGDLIVTVNGLSYGQILGFLFSRSALSDAASFTLIRGDRELALPLETTPYTLSSLLSIIWPHLLLITVLLSLAVAALLRAPLSRVSRLFFLMLCGFSSAISSTLASNMGLLSPLAQSASFVSIALFNWFSFAAFLHFVCRFPEERDITINRPWLLSLFYFFPVAVTLLISLIFSGISWDFWSYLQRFRNMFVPLFIAAIFIKHLVDFVKLPTTELARNQIKLPLFAFWFSFGPYLFLYLLPNLLFNQPLIQFRTVILAFLALPIAYLFALLRYRLFEVDKMISKVLAYFILIIVITSFYALFLVGVKQWLYGKDLLSTELFLVFLLLVISLINPAVNWLQQIINRLIFANSPVQPATLHLLSRRIGTAIQLPNLVQAMTQDLPDRFGLDKAALVVINQQQLEVYPAQPGIHWPEEISHSELIAQFQGYEEYFRCAPVSVGGRYEKQMQAFGQQGWALILKLHGAGELIGLLFIGQKATGRLLNMEDIHLLATLANHAGVALENGLRYEKLISSKKQQEATLQKLIQAEKMATIGEMTATLTHELKNPLAIIRGSAQYVAEGKRSPIVAKEMLGNIMEEIDTLNLTINSLLGLARHRPPTLKPVDPNTAIADIIQKWQHSGDHQPGIQITYQSELPMPPLRPSTLLYCDVSQLAQILLNLIRNAEEVMRSTGEISLRASLSGEHVLIQVRDTGPGIDPEQLNLVFDPFFSSKNSGAGLGLSVCKQLVQAHHGSIHIKNAEKGGTEVWFLLPLGNRHIIKD